MSTPDRRVIVVLGTTAAGKAGLARELAVRLDGDVVSMDSMKVYRGMDIGTAKPTPAQQARCPHHLIDIIDPWDFFSAALWVERADAAIARIHAAGRPAIVVGGTMLYFTCFYKGLFEGPPADETFRAALQERIRREGLAALHAELAAVDPDAAARIHVQDNRRIERALEVHHLTGRPITELQKQWDAQGPRHPEWHWQRIGLRREKEIESRRSNARVKRMLERGLVEEARRIWSDPRGHSTQAAQAVGYRELFAHFEGRCSEDEAIERIKINTRHLAKNQRTWMRRMTDLPWLDLAGDEEAAGRVADAEKILGQGSREPRAGNRDSS